MRESSCGRLPRRDTTGPSPTDLRPSALVQPLALALWFNLELNLVLNLVVNLEFNLTLALELHKVLTLPKYRTWLQTPSPSSDKTKDGLTLIGPSRSLMKHWRISKYLNSPHLFMGVRRSPVKKLSC
jgi:hypothetical protein